MTAEPMLPVGQKMRRSDDFTTEVEASGPDWAIIRVDDVVRVLERGHRDDGSVVDDRDVRWVPVTEPATWDVRPSIGVLHVVPTKARGRVSAVQVRPSLVPDHIDADDLAHRIAVLLEAWPSNTANSELAADHRAAQTEREAS